MIGYTEAEQRIREQLGLPYATGADEPPSWHDGSEPEGGTTMSTVTVTVTQEHIGRGLQRDCNFCPISLAIADAMPGTLCAEVMPASLGYAVIATAEAVTSMILPGSARRFITEFDNGQTVYPFAFTAEVTS